MVREGNLYRLLRHCIPRNDDESSEPYIETASPQSLNAKLRRTYRCDNEVVTLPAANYPDRIGEYEVTILRSGYRICIPHRQPQLEVRCRATGNTPRQAGLANREASLPSGEPNSEVLLKIRACSSTFQ